VGWDANGYAQQDDLYFCQSGTSGNYGTEATPVYVAETVNVKPGRRYRFQFFQGCEDCGKPPLPDGTTATSAYNRFPGHGLAAIDITGYDRTYLEVYPVGNYRTLDFIAKSAQTTIKIMSWGHIPILFQQNYRNCADGIYATDGSCVTELALDDTILTECEAPCAPMASVTPLANHMYKYNFKVKCPKVKMNHNGTRVDTAMLTLQLPAGSSLVSSKTTFKIQSTPVVDDDNVLTWTIPNPNPTLNLNLKIMFEDCVPRPDLVGHFCYGDNCQGLSIPKQVSKHV